MFKEQNQRQLQNRYSSSSLISSGEYHNPYFLQHADTPGSMLVSTIADWRYLLYIEQFDNHGSYS